MRTTTEAGPAEQSMDGSTADVGGAGRLLMAIGRRVLAVEQSLPAAVRRNFGGRILVLAAVSLVVGPAVAVLLFSEVLTAVLFVVAVVGVTGFLGYCEMYTAIIALSEGVAAVRDDRFNVAFEWDRVDELGAAFDGFEALAASLGESIETAEREKERVSTLLADLEAEAETYSERMERAAEGDLTVRLPEDADSDAMARVATAFNGMLADLEATVGDIQQFADEVAAASEEVTARAAEVEEAGEEVSEAVQGISEGADRQGEQLREVSVEMQNVSGAVEEVAASADQVATVAERAAETGERGRGAATEALEAIERIEQRTAGTVERVEGLAEEVAIINEVADLIADIATQTDTLALNASIEAASAGEAGEGFAVVADEVKDLAEETATAVARIEDIVADVRAAADDTVEDIRETGDPLSAGTETVEEALGALEELAGQVEEVNRGIQEINDATDDQAGSTEEVARTVDEVSEIGERTSEETGRVSAAAQQQAAAVAEVADRARSLAEGADDLQERLAGFAVDLEGHAGRTATGGRGQGERPRGRRAADGGTPGTGGDGGE